MCATVRFAAQSIAPFDTAACRQEALKKGIPDGDLAGWMRYKVAMYYALANRANEIGASAKMRETEGVKTTDTSACANMNFIMQNFTYAITKVDIIQSQERCIFYIIIRKILWALEIGWQIISRPVLDIIQRTFYTAIAFKKPVIGIVVIIKVITQSAMSC